ncbi:hypothetical protein JTB14_038013 [Gonioctena quinquepunctata]|nr:hypothetical protein JTB14_038013 [Gonioctena quinquepunctata]
MRAPTVPLNDVNGKISFPPANPSKINTSSEGKINEPPPKKREKRSRSLSTTVNNTNKNSEDDNLTQTNKNFTEENIFSTNNEENSSNNINDSQKLDYIEMTPTDTNIDTTDIDKMNDN